jgi:hypothetical protein
MLLYWFADVFPKFFDDFLYKYVYVWHVQCTVHVNEYKKIGGISAPLTYIIVITDTLNSRALVGKRGWESSSD